MAQMILSSVGSAIAGPVGGWIGGTLGRRVDHQLLRAAVAAVLPGKAVGRRLTGLQLNGVAEGQPLPAAYGRVRVGGQIIWAARFRERRVEQSSGGGKSNSLSSALSGGGSTYRYAYSLSFAVGLGEGPVDGVGRIWADGRLLDTTGLALRTYTGAADQTPDALIAAVEGDAPAYRGLAYLVFEDLDLTPFGGHPPSISAELFRRPSWPGAPPRLEDRLAAVCLIPGAGEAVYATSPVLKVTGLASTTAENVNSASGGADVLAALDQLQAQLPAVRHVNLVTAWFGDDLRCGVCTVRPGVETADKTTLPADWSAGGVGRSGARVISQGPGGSGPAYGGTPSDASVLALPAELARRRLSATLYPFLLMDIPAGNTLPDPYGDPAQAAYPWRGRITADPARPVGEQVAAFFGTASPDQFQVSATGVGYSGPAEWSYRRMVLHQAALAAASGLAGAPVESFLIGSELRGLTTLRDASGGYPVVAPLVQLARDCARLLGPAVKLGYAADWSEYSGHQPPDGSGDAVFHLDPLWSDPAIAFVGVDWYAPVTDWRDGTAHLDALAGYGGTADPAYLADRVAGGEAFDWYYADAAGRAAQTRLPITDGAYGEPWMFRPKDLAGWWSNLHHDRRGGVRSVAPTGWVPGMKPVRIIEFGCPAVDKGANAPNDFLDAKSAESRLPPFSGGAPDDLGQRRLIEAMLAHYATPGPANPVSPVYGGPMVAAADLAAWCWDARPFPEFPGRDALWADAANWARGHWLNGRTGTGELADLVAALLLRGGVDPRDADLSGLSGLVQGFLVDGPARLLDTLAELAEAFAFDPAEQGGRIACVARDAAPVMALGADQLALTTPETVDPLQRMRSLAPTPDLIRVRHADAHRDYQSGQAFARADPPEGGGDAQLDLPLCLAEAQARGIGARRLRRLRAERDTVLAHLAPDAAHRLEPGDIVTLGADPKPWRVVELDPTDTPVAHLRGMEAADIPALNLSLPVFQLSPAARPAGPPGLALLDLPPLPGVEDDIRPLLAVAGEPWRGVEVAAGPSTDALTQRARVNAPAPLGRLVGPLAPGPLHRFDNGPGVEVALAGLTLASLSDAAVRNGANGCAVLSAAGDWELLQYARAEMTGADQWRLTRLLRGQGGTDAAMRAGAAAGATFVPLTDNLVRAAVAQSERGLPLVWRATAGGGSAALGVTDLSATWTGIALRPWSPAHFRAVRLDNGDLAVSWIRRARLHGDPLDGEPPLGEEAELYRLNLLDAGGIVRSSLQTTTAAATYAAAQQATDFAGIAGGPAALEVRQNSAVYGWGSPTRIAL
jgi:GTA TIM-barrel-like domain/Putative phage tail protein